MNILHTLRNAFGLAIVLSLNCAAVNAEDIDIFVGNSTTAAGLPNVIFVLDNTSNWSRQSQQWPGGLAQGQAEARAIKTSLTALIDKANVGLFEFTTSGNASQDGGFVRFNLQQLTGTSKALLDVELDEIFNNINGTTEKRNSGTPYGNLMYDLYNYLGGKTQSFSGGGTEPTKADSSGYSSLYSTFRSPLDAANACANTYVIFIGNPNSSGPSADSSTNSAALSALYAALDDSADGLATTSGTAPIPIPEFTVTTVTEPSTTLGYSTACYTSTDTASCNVAETTSGLCLDKTDCACDATDTITTGGTPACITTGAQSSRTKRFAVKQGGGTSTVVAPSGGYDATAGLPWNFDDWAKFLHDYGVPITAVNEAGLSFEQRVKVVTYTIDVFNKQQNEDHTGLMLSGAQVGGGRYFAARNEDAIVDAITTALSDILSVSSTFAAVTLPLSATNRAQSENQVFIGMFRPDQAAKPRWFGNLKRYQVGLENGEPFLADAIGANAINPVSGFAAECAQSYWSTDSADYWAGLGITPAPTSQCIGSIYDQWSDLPDGPFVEKGGAAQISRKSDLSARNLLTASGSSLTAMSATQLGGDQDLFDYLRGSKTGEGEAAPASGGRPSIHGDVIHSRPLTVNYGGSTGTYIFYGSNDGLFRAIKASTGGESWSLLAPEHYGLIQRLYSNLPLVKFPNQPDSLTPAPTAKDYFFDGSTGQVVTYNENDQVDKAYIYPTMRRGGRMVYALNVTSPASPSLLWRRGCDALGAGASCDSGFSDLGQTWSTPKGASLSGYTSGEVVMFGGGYDSCLDADQAAYPCSSSAKGRGIYVLDAKTGALLAGPAQLQTDAPVVADLTLVDMDVDGKTDFAYAADAAGGLYRISFATLGGQGGLTALDKAAWSITKLASVSGSTRRFLNAPVAFALKDRVFLGLGSGNRERPLESNYPYSASVQDRFYVLADFPSISTAQVDLDGSDMLAVEVSPGEGVDCAARGKRGWSLSMPDRGEQVVNPGAFLGGKVFFNSYRPGGSSVGVCSRPLGLARGYEVDLLSPACSVVTTEIPGGGMPIAPTTATVNVVCPAGSTSCTPGEDTAVSICIGCKGLDPDKILAAPPTTRSRSYWSGDVDR